MSRRASLSRKMYNYSAFFTESLRMQTLSTRSTDRSKASTWLIGSSIIQHFSVRDSRRLFARSSFGKHCLQKAGNISVTTIVPGFRAYYGLSKKVIMLNKTSQMKEVEAINNIIPIYNSQFVINDYKLRRLSPNLWNVSMRAQVQFITDQSSIDKDFDMSFPIRLQRTQIKPREFSRSSPTHPPRPKRRRWGLYPFRLPLRLVKLDRRPLLGALAFRRASSRFLHECISTAPEARYDRSTRQSIAKLTIDSW